MRARFLLISSGALFAAACATQVTPKAEPSDAPMAPPSGEPRELLPEEQVQQVLNRLTFGPKPGEAEQVRAMGVDKWIALQLTPERIDDSKTDQYLASAYPILSMPLEQTVQMYDQARQAQQQLQKRLAAEGDTNAKRDAHQELKDNPDLAAKIQSAQRGFAEVQSAKLARAVMSDRQLQEVMVDFWENHFSVFAGKGQTRFFLASYDRDVIRPHALGKFRDLLEAVAKSPAMLFFLDNWQSAADSTHPTLTGPRSRGGMRVAMRRPGIFVPVRPQQRPGGPRGLNENYARELMELHTLGVDGGYTQHDVIEVARALTGWSFNPRDGQFVFRPQIHDADEKVVLGHKLPAGRGIEDGEEVLDLLARSPATAHFIAKKLVIRFVSDSAPPELVNRAAQTYLTTNGDIREVLRTIVTSPDFFSRAAYRAKVKSPFELVASALRAMNAAPDSTPRDAQIVAYLGEPIFGHQTPEGWPERGDAWMNTGAILNRINFGLAVAAARVPGVIPERWPYAVELRRLSHEQQVDGVTKVLLGGQVSSETRSVLLNGANPMLAKYATAADSLRTESDTLAMDQAMERPEAPVRLASARPGPPGPGGRGGGGAGPLGRPVELTGLSQVIGLALGAPEFQRR